VIKHMFYLTGRSCWVYWRRASILPSSYLSTRRRAQTFLPNLSRRLGWVLVWWQLLSGGNKHYLRPAGNVKTIKYINYVYSNYYLELKLSTTVW